MNKLIMLQRYMYYFVGGGFNTQMAESVEQAYELACERWEDAPSLQPRKDSFKLVSENEEEYKMNLRSFW